MFINIFNIILIIYGNNTALRSKFALHRMYLKKLRNATGVFLEYNFMAHKICKEVQIQENVTLNEII